MWVRYDAGGNPTTYSNNDCAYDGAGRRMWKEVDGVRTYFLYDGDAPLLEFRDINNANRITAINLYGAPSLLGRRVLTYNESTGEFLSAQTIYYQCEATGNVVHRLNESGAILTTQLYDAYGQLMNVRDGSGQEQAPSVLADDPYGYKGRFGYYTDHETALILCTHRYYDPQIGRWLTRDPIGYDDGLNMYRYCGNNPVTGVDPSGLITNFYDNFNDYHARVRELMHKYGVNDILSRAHVKAVAHARNTASDPRGMGTNLKRAGTAVSAFTFTVVAIAGSIPGMAAAGAGMVISEASIGYEESKYRTKWNNEYNYMFRKYLAECTNTNDTVHISDKKNWALFVAEVEKLSENYSWEQHNVGTAALVGCIYGPRVIATNENGELYLANTYGCRDRESNRDPKLWL